MPKVKPAILICLQDHKYRAILSARFEAANFKTEGVESVSEAERKAVKLRPDIFLVEALGDVEWVKESLRHWRSLPTMLKTKIVFLMSEPSRLLLNTALKNGAETVIVSGTISPKDMVNFIEKKL